MVSKVIKKLKNRLSNRALNRATPNYTMDVFQRMPICCKAIQVVYDNLKRSRLPATVKLQADSPERSWAFRMDVAINWVLSISCSPDRKNPALYAETLLISTNDEQHPYSRTVHECYSHEELVNEIIKVSKALNTPSSK